MDFIEKPLRDIEPQFSAMGYMFTREIKLGGPSFISRVWKSQCRKKSSVDYGTLLKQCFL